MTGTTVWLVAASLYKMPVSTTHSIVGAVVGFAWVQQGIEGHVIIFLFLLLRLYLCLSSLYMSTYVYVCLGFRLLYLKKLGTV